ncbi:eukaryotic translation initiation factor 4B isoform X2 [Phlebotomus argentipes]|uniref:eukaryotic translation initiation factor 4B isoform X2 n=1 Tax=Phlebotomus argentipes TaxID=94469 RepID=UPI0028937D1E|nr:eukaryotic translation initiation factor 4B isoform X2 [Phlebotomus argentipes]
MATTDKKKKKTKAKAVPLQDFLAASGGVNTVQMPRKVSSWADEIEEDEHEKRQIIALPTAPRASRIFNDDSVPHSPPFLAYISNLPYDVLEEDIRDFFMGYHIVSLRLPREDGEMGRLRGFGYIEFETRNELIDAVSMSDPSIRNRRVRIDVSNESDQKQRGGRNNRYGDRERDDRDMTNWRRGNDSNNDRDGDSRRGGYGGFRDRERDSGAPENSNWRLGDRPNLDAEPPRRGFSDGPRERYGGRRSNYEERKRDPEPTEVRERPKLNLKPRTLPIEPIVVQPEPEPEAAEERAETPRDSEPEQPPPPKAEPVPAAKIFGDAKPVDTAAREREIEERMERDRLEKQKALEEEKLRAKQDKENERPEDESSPPEGEVKEVKKEEIISWRTRPADTSDDSGGDSNRRRPSPRRYSPDDRRGQPKRLDDRRGYRDNRDSYQRDRDYKDGRNQGRPRDSRQDAKYRDRYDERDGRGNRERNDRERDREQGGYRHANEERPQTVRREKPQEDGRDIEDRMPKYKPAEAPNLSMSNKYAAFLNDEADE